MKKLTKAYIDTLITALDTAAKELAEHRQNRPLTKHEIFSELLLAATRKRSRLK